MDEALSHFEDRMAKERQAAGAALESLIPMAEGPEARVIEAMRYSALSGGKRLRPFLVLASADIFNVGRSCSERVAAAVEMIHCYSLIHDDLPAMDDDDLRRGLPTCHIRYDEATAILAGDALLTLAFEVLAGEETHGQPAVRCELISELAGAIGSQGMVGGQMLDLVADGHDFDVAEITRLQRLKTGMLIGYSCQAGAILGRAHDEGRAMLSAYAHDLGLAFQIIDDLLDVEGEESEVGKATGKDAAAGKATFVSLLGRERARAQAEMLAGQAIEHIAGFGEKGFLLKELADFVVQRRK